MVFGGAPLTNHTSGATQLQSYHYPGPMQPASTTPTVLAYTHTFGGAPFTNHTSGATQLQSYLFPGALQPQPSSGAISLTAGQGTYTLTGVSAVLRRSRVTTASSGSYAINGQSVNLVYTAAGRILTASQGSLSLSGQTSILRKGSRSVNSAGSFTLSGQAVNLTYAASPFKVLTASVGLFSIAGKTVELRYGVKVGGIGLRSAHALKPHKPHEPPYKHQFPSSHEISIHQSASILAKSGGHARARNLTPSQRVNIARNAANARWK